MVDTHRELWENEYGSIPYDIEGCVSSLREVINRRDLELSVAENHDSVIGAQTVFAIRGPRLHVNMSSGVPRYFSTDGRLVLETRSDATKGVCAKPNLMWVVKCAKTLDVLMRSRRFATRGIENDVCPHCIFSCPCVGGGSMDWKGEGATVYSVSARHVTPDGDGLPIDADVPEDHANMTIRVRAALYDDIRELAIKKCPGAKLHPFSTPSGKSCSHEAEADVAHYLNEKTMREARRVPENDLFDTISTVFADDDFIKEDDDAAYAEALDDESTLAGLVYDSGEDSVDGDILTYIKSSDATRVKAKTDDDVYSEMVIDTFGKNAFESLKDMEDSFKGLHQRNDAPDAKGAPVAKAAPVAKGAPVAKCAPVAKPVAKGEVFGQDGATTHIFMVRKWVSIYSLIKPMATGDVQSIFDTQGTCFTGQIRKRFNKGMLMLYDPNPRQFQQFMMETHALFDGTSSGWYNASTMLACTLAQFERDLQAFSDEQKFPLPKLTDDEKQATLDAMRRIGHVSDETVLEFAPTASVAPTAPKPRFVVKPKADEPKNGGKILERLQRKVQQKSKFIVPERDDEPEISFLPSAAAKERLKSVEEAEAIAAEIIKAEQDAKAAEAAKAKAAEIAKAARAKAAAEAAAIAKAAKAAKAEYDAREAERARSAKAAAKAEAAAKAAAKAAAEATKISSNKASKSEQKRLLRNAREDADMARALEESARLNALEERNRIFWNAAARLQANVRRSNFNHRMQALHAAAELMASARYELRTMARRRNKEECGMCLEGFDYDKRLPLTAPCSHMPICDACCNDIAASDALCFCGVNHFDRLLWRVSI